MLGTAAVIPITEPARLLESPRLQAQAFEPPPQADAWTLRLLDVLLAGRTAAGAPGTRSDHREARAAAHHTQAADKGRLGLLALLLRPAGEGRTSRRFASLLRRERRIPSSATCAGSSQTTFASQRYGMRILSTPRHRARFYHSARTYCLDIGLPLGGYSCRQRRTTSTKGGPNT